MKLTTKVGDRVRVCCNGTYKFTGPSAAVVACEPFYPAKLLPVVATCVAVSRSAIEVECGRPKDRSIARFWTRSWVRVAPAREPMTCPWCKSSLCRNKKQHRAQFERAYVPKRWRKS